MEPVRLYSLPKLPYEYSALAPYISEEQMKLHHLKHHQAYVTGANAVLERMDKARKDNVDVDQKATLKELSFHMGGFRLHNRFWENLAPAGKGGGGIPKGSLAKVIDDEFGKFERFKKEFTQAATSVEGSGWAIATYCEKTKEAAYPAGGETQCEHYSRFCDTSCSRCLGACILPGLQE